MQINDKVEVLSQFLIRTFSNLLGGMANYNGNLKILNKEEIQQRASKWVLSFTPDRVGFPRGFLWDDGFHLLILAKSLPGDCVPFI